MNSDIMHWHLCLAGETSVTVSLVWPTLCLFKGRLLKEEEGDTELTKDINRRIVTYLFDKYTSDQRCENFMKVSTYLDPGFKSQYDNKRNEVLLQMELVNPPCDNNEQTEAVVAEADGTSSNKRKLSDFFSTPQAHDHETDTRKHVFEVELDMYVLSPQVENKGINVLTWWRDNQVIYPNLCRVARKYVCVPATSVPSERVFSSAGLIVSDRRACLKPEKVNQLVFLNQNV